MLEFRCPSRLNETQVKLLVGPVDFVAHNWVPDGCEMRSYLMGSSRKWNCTNQTELLFSARRLVCMEFFPVLTFSLFLARKRKSPRRWKR